jgi:tetratricopeptide (TPR) repeat protein
MLSLDAVQPLLSDAFHRFVQYMRDVDEPDTDPLPQAIRRYFRVKTELGTAKTAERFGIRVQDLEVLEAAARDVERTLNALEASPGSTSVRNAILAQFRLLSWLETCDRNVPVQLIGEDLEALVSTEMGHKQVRALELIVRSLVTESYGEQERLIGRLRDALNERVVQEWKTKADPGDILSGLTFSELASLFINKQEFHRYEKLYEDTPFLTLLKQRRRTIQAFLDDVRRIRNILAHNKKVTSTQLTLLDLYYEEIVQPVQAAYDHGETSVDPGTYLEVSSEGLQRYMRHLREDLNEIRDDLAEFRKSVEEKLGIVGENTAVVRKTTEGIDRKVIAVGVGVAALLGASFFVLRQGDRTQEEVEAVRDASKRTERAARASTELAKRTGEAIKESARETKEAVDRAAASSARVAKTLESLRDGVAALTQEGGIISETNRASSHYHNARIYEQRGDTAKAIESYRRFFSFPDQEVIDPHLRYQRLLKLQHGPGGAREIYHAMKSDSKSSVTAFAWILLLPRESRIEHLIDYIEDNPDFSPAHYELSRDYSVARRGTQTLAEMRREKKHLTEFLAAQEKGEFLRFYLDQSVAARQVEDARSRLAALSSVAETALAEPVTMSSVKSNDAWIVTFAVAEATKDLFVKIGDDAFKNTGHLPHVDPVTRLPTPRLFTELPLTAGETELQVKYTDRTGGEHGPYTLIFEPGKEMVKSVKSMLLATKSSWVMFRDWGDEVLLYFTHLLAYREALSEIRYGLDNATPDTLFPWSPADPKNPYAIGVDDETSLSIPADTKFVTVQLTFKDGSTTEIIRIER